MSQIDNKVKWCLNKARREIDQGLMHRGLVRVEPDIEETKKHIAKAEHNYKAVLSFEKTGFSDWSVSAGFYVIYHCFLAVINKFGYESRNQECTIALIQLLKKQKSIDLPQDIICALEQIKPEERHKDNVITMRENFQYGTDTEIEDDKLTDIKELCKKAINETKKIIYDEKY